MSVFKRLLQLYIAFFKVGLLTIGGGYAMLPIIEREIVKDLELTTMDVVAESYTLSQTLPGVIASNAAALIGYRIYKKKGALVCTLGVVTPSIIIILFLARVFTEIEHIEAVQNAFKGIRIVVLALLIDSFTRLFKMAIFDKKTFILAGLAFILVLFSLVNPVLVILSGGVLGIMIYRERVNQ